MNWQEAITNNLELKLLSLFLAIVLWLFVIAGRDAQTGLSLPVSFANLPPGLAVSGTPPPRLDVLVSGPRILLLRLEASPSPVILDLKDAGEGTIVFPAMATRVRVPDGVRVTRAAPAEIEVRLVKAGPSGSGK